MRDAQTSRYLHTYLLAWFSMAGASKVYVGIDAGTQGLKALVYDAAAKKVLSRASRSYSLEPNAADAPIGRAEQRPSVWVDAMWSATNEALDGASAAAGTDVRAVVSGIGVSGQQHGLVALDEGFNVLRPAKLWCDTESAPEAEALSAMYGRTMVASFTATKLLWLKNHEPETFARMAHVALPHDYLNYVLTGSLVMEGGDASGTGLLEPDARVWDAGAVGAIDQGLLSKLPPLIAPTENAGALQADPARRLSLPAGIVVSAGGGDNMMSALGCGCATIGRVAISLGTSGTIFAKTERAARDSSGTVCPFLDATGGGLPLVCTLNCAAAPEEVRTGYGLSRAEIGALAEAEPIGCEGITMLPYLAGERTPNWPDASGVIHGLRPGHLARPGLLYRAALEGATFSLRAGIEAMKQHGLPERLDEVRLVGGGSKSALWRQILADALQVRVACPCEAESAALGAALQSAALDAAADDIGAWILTNHDPLVGDVVEPEPAVACQYDEAFARYQTLGTTLFGSS